jgi:hypothetical protein
MKSIVVAALLLLTITGSVQARQGSQRDMRSCLVEVLHSEEVPIGPLFYHTVKTTLLVTAPNTPPFETTVYRVISWQMPPPRRGQRMRVGCDPAVLNSSFGFL